MSATDPASTARCCAATAVVVAALLIVVAALAWAFTVASGAA